MAESSLPSPSSNSAPSRRRIARPIGVTLLAAFDGIFIGLVPLVMLLVISNDAGLSISTADYYITAGLRILVVVSALGAFFGENAGRLVLLSAVTAVSTLMVVSSIGLLSNGEVTPAVAGLIGNVPRGIFWIILNCWYLNRKTVVEYFRQEKASEDPNTKCRA
jgi:hypothetical protein